MGRIREKFEQLKYKKRAAFIPYVMAGYPDLESSQSFIEALCEVGCDLVEIGFPYSEPLADGKSIEAASSLALKEGVTTDKVFSMIGKLRKKLLTPFIAMTYYNVVYSYGLERFARKAALSGVDGVIIADLPPEEAFSWVEVAHKKGLDTIFLVAPTSTKERIKFAEKFSSGFMYCVSLTGVTGARKNLPSYLPQFARKVKKLVSIPVAVGFGISLPHQAREIAKICDGVIIGSAFIDLIKKENTSRRQVAAIREFACKILDALKFDKT